MGNFVFGVFVEEESSVGEVGTQGEAGGGKTKTEEERLVVVSVKSNCFANGVVGQVYVPVLLSAAADRKKEEYG